MSTDVSTEVLRRVAAALDNAGQPDFCVSLSTEPNTFLDSSYVAIVRAVPEGGPDARQRVRDLYDVLGASADCETLFVQIGETNDRVPTLWVSSRLWYCGGTQ